MPCDRAVLADVSKALDGLEMLERVTGRPGLMARYFSRDPAPFDPLVDLFWRWKAAFVYLGAALMAASLLIMVGLTGHTDQSGPQFPGEILHQGKVLYL